MCRSISSSALILAAAFAFVRRFVGRFDVDADQVDVGQRLDRVAPLGGVIGVEIAGGARHFDASPAHQRRQPAQQIDGRDHRALLAIQLRRTAARRRAALAPQPDVRGRQLALAGGVRR